MNPLASLQQQFQSRIIEPDDSQVPWIDENGRASPETQLSVYVYAYRARLKEVLESDFPAVNLALGSDAFDVLVEAYIAAYPSKYFSLRQFGDNLPGFIQRHEYSRDYPWLYELALFEWTLCSAFDAADAPVLDDTNLASIAPEDWPQLRFEPHPSLQRLDFVWNIPEMWNVLTSDNPTEIQAIGDQESYWIVWRNNLVTRFRSLPADERSALDCLRAGGNFNDLCETLIEYHDFEQVPLRAATLLKDWLAQGLISRLFF